MVRRVAYRSGFVNRLDDVGSLPVWSIDGSHLPEDVLEFVEPLLDLRGTYGDPDAGDPIQYDHLLIEHDQGEVEIVVYNRAIPLFATDREAVRRIQQVCCRLDDIATRPRPATSTRRSIWLRLVPARRQ